MILTSLYELPFGKGKHFMGNIGRGADMLLGGWQWNTTMVIGSGLPYSPSYGECNLDRDTGPCRPSLNGSFHHGSGSFNNQTRQVRTSRRNPPLFATVRSVAAAGRIARTIVTQSGPFSASGIAQFGNIHRNQFTGPGEFMSDMSLFKNFTITEQVKAQFQAEFFNVFNHPFIRIRQYLY